MGTGEALLSYSETAWGIETGELTSDDEVENEK